MPMPCNSGPDGLIFRDSDLVGLGLHSKSVFVRIFSMYLMAARFGIHHFLHLCSVRPGLFCLPLCLVCGFLKKMKS